MSRKTRKLIWSAPLMAVLAVAGALAIFAAQLPHSVYADALPGTPTGLTAKADGRNAVDLSWNAPTDGGSVDGYRIDRSTNGHTWESFQGASMDMLIQGTSYRDTMLSSGTDYIYRVFAVNGHGAGPTSDDAGTTTDAIEAPGMVRNLQATDGSYPTKIVLTWQPPADNGGRAITAYYVNIKKSDGTWPTSRFDAENDAEVIKVDVEADICAVNGEMPSTETVTYMHTPLLANVDHSYRVYASNGETAADANTQSASDTDTGSTGDPVAPDKVTDLVLLKDPDTDNVRIYWVEPESNGGQTISGFRLHVSKTNRHWSRFADATITIDATSLDDTNAVAADITVPTANTDAYQFTHPIPADLTGTWYYRIYTETMDADNTNDATETPLRSLRAEGRVWFGDIIPRQPGAITGTGVSHDQIDLSWAVTEWNSADGTATDANTPANNVRRPTGYRVDVSEDAIKWTTVLEDNTNLALPEFSHETGVKAGDDFMYRVFPIFASRIGPAVHVTTAVSAADATVPGNVRNLRAVESGAGRIMVTWDAPMSDGGSSITGYRVEESSDQTTWTLSSTRLSCQLSFTDTGLAEETTLYYRVIPLNSVNAADDYFDTPANYPADLVERSATTTAADLPPAPIGLTVEPAKDSTIQTHGDRGILVYWNAPDDPDGAPIENYRVERRVKPNTTDPWGDWEWVQTCLSTAGTLLYTHCTDPQEPKLDIGEMRMYKVAAQNAAGIGAFTDPITTPRPGMHMHVAPSGTIADRYVTVDTMTTVDASMYFSDNAGATYAATSSMTDYATVSVDGSIVTITGVAEGMTEITITATSGALSAMQTFKVTVIDVPGAPTMVEAEADSRIQITVEWDAPADNGGSAVTRYIVEQSYMGAFLDDGIAHPDHVFDNHMEWWETLNCEGMLLAVGSDADHTDMSNADVMMYCGHFLNTAPTNITDATKELSAEAKADVEMYFNMRYKITDAMTMSASFMDLNPGGTYMYRVKAVNDAGAGMWSATASATTTANMMPMAGDAIGDVTATEGDDPIMVQSTITDGDDAMLTWTASSDHGDVAAATADNMGMVTITIGHAGTATIKVKATDMFDAYAEQTFMVTVEAADTELAAPTITSVDVDDSDPGSFKVTIEWMDGANADGHEVGLVDLSDYRVAHEHRVTDGATSRTFSNVAPGRYIAIVVSTQDAEFLYDAELVTVQ